MREPMKREPLEINEAYAELCCLLLGQDQTVGNTRELEDVCFSIDVSLGNIVSVRNISLPYLFGEMTWYLAGSQDMNFISKFGSMWERISDDGKTSNSAYGHILMRRHGFNQIDKMVELLQADPNSRRAVININVPNARVIETKDEPCTVMLQFLLRDGELNCTGVMRSNDIWFGLPYDVVFFTEVQKEIARRLGVKAGMYTHFVTSLHVYERNLEDIKKVVATDWWPAIHVDFERLWHLAPIIYDEVMKADDPKEAIVREFEKYGLCDEVRR